MSGELWLAEGFTSYYGPLVMLRAGLSRGRRLHRRDGVASSTPCMSSPARRLRSAEEMSRLAPFVDAAAAIDRTNFDNTFISYYTWGAAIGLGLDLTLRDRSNGTVTLDHFMRALWQKHGKPGGKAPGYVDVPYTMADLKAALASVAGDARVRRRLLRPLHPGTRGRGLRARCSPAPASCCGARRPAAHSPGELRLQDVQGRPRVTGAAPFGSPAYQAGLDRDDVILAVAGTDVASVGRCRAAHPRAQARRRRCRSCSSAAVSASPRCFGSSQDPRVEIVRAEDGGPSPDAAQTAVSRRMAELARTEHLLKPHMPDEFRRTLPGIRDDDGASRGRQALYGAARSRSAPPASAPSLPRMQSLAGQLEAPLTNVVVAALKEAFDRDHARLELERAQLEEERRRAEQALRLELRRQAADRELGAAPAARRGVAGRLDRVGRRCSPPASRARRSRARRAGDRMDAAARRARRGVHRAGPGGQRRRLTAIGP